MTLPGKLVRDGIPAIIEQTGGIPITQIASPDDYPHYLRAKLSEETGEYLTSGDVTEIADIMEVCFALAEIHGISKTTLLTLTDNKRCARGGFTNHIIWLANLSHTTLSGDV